MASASESLWMIYPTALSSKSTCSTKYLVIYSGMNKKMTRKRLKMRRIKKNTWKNLASSTVPDQRRTFKKKQRII
jgi:hypothetical protein